MMSRITQVLSLAYAVYNHYLGRVKKRRDASSLRGTRTATVVVPSDGDVDYDLIVKEIEIL